MAGGEISLPVISASQIHTTMATTECRYMVFSYCFYLRFHQT
uniref:Uncharacterized protein n=1 Tax=Anguilla anguilla TaxID=7936 RepID=A0A0E9PK99_ANGAN